MNGPSGLGDPVDLGGGRGLYMYGGSEIVTRQGGRVRVQDSSDAPTPHVRVLYKPGKRESDQIHLNLMEAIEVRDRLTQFIEGVAETWGAEWLQDAMKSVAQHRAAQREIGKD